MVPDCPQCGESDDVWGEEDGQWYCDNCNITFPVSDTDRKASEPLEST